MNGACVQHRQPAACSDRRTDKVAFVRQTTAVPLTLHLMHFSSIYLFSYFSVHSHADVDGICTSELNRSDC